MPELGLVHKKNPQFIGWKIPPTPGGKTDQSVNTPGTPVKIRGLPRGPVSPSIRVDQTGLQGIPNQLDHVVRVHFFHDITAVLVDRFRTQARQPSDFLSALPLDQHLEYFPLPF